jgi:hypothetical protein
MSLIYLLGAILPPFIEDAALARQAKSFTVIDDISYDCTYLDLFKVRLYDIYGH